MSIFWLIIAFAAFIVWIFILLAEDLVNFKVAIKRERRRRRLVEEAKRKKAKELKWPEGVPYYIEEMYNADT